MRLPRVALFLAIVLGCSKTQLTVHGTDGSPDHGSDTGGSSGNLPIGDAGSGGSGGPPDGGRVMGGAGGGTTKPSSGGSGGTSVPGTGGAAARLTTSATTLNLGTIDVGRSALTTVTLSNVGTVASGNVTITASTGVTAVGCPMPLAAGGSCTITVAVSPTAVGAFAGTVAISANPGARTPLLVAVIAIVTGGGLTVTPTLVGLGPVFVGTPINSTLTVTATVSITELTVIPRGPDVVIDMTTTTCTSALAAGASCLLVVRFLATATGDLSDSIEIAGDGKVVTVPISAVGKNLPTLAISPNTPQTFMLNQDVLPLPITFTVGNNGDGPTGIIAPTLTGANAGDFRIGKNDCLVLAALASCTLAVQFRPSMDDAATTRSATLVVSDTGLGASVVSVPLTGTISTRAWLLISPPTADLGATAVGTVGPAKVLTILNASTLNTTGPLTVATSAAELIVGSDTCSGTDLAPLATCTVTVAFQPSIAGAKSGLFIVAGTNTFPVTASLTGTGSGSAP